MVRLQLLPTLASLAWDGASLIFFFLTTDGHLLPNHSSGLGDISGRKVLGHLDLSPYKNIQTFEVYFSF